MESKEKKPIVPILVGLLVVAIGVIVFLVTSQGKPAEQVPAKQVEVPDITFMKRADAEAELAKVGLKVGKVTEQEEIFGGFVLSSDPESGKSVDVGSYVNIVVSKGEDIDEPVAVPDLTGMTVEEAEEALMKLWIIPQPGEPTYSDAVEAGKVCAQSVAPGTKIAKIETVTYSVSLGKEQVVVPDVTGKSVAEARDAINGAGLSCDTVTAYSDTVAKDVVISQNIAKDQKVNKGTTLTIEVSLGKKPAAKVVIPNIVTYSLADAKKALDSAGLKYTYTGDEDGTVTAVRPVAGTQVDQGSTVEFELEKPQPVKPVEPAKPTAEPAEPAEPSNEAEKSGEAREGTSESTTANEDADDGFEAAYTKEQCTAMATEAMGAGGQATGPALNLVTSDLITGGGTQYYYVEYDLGSAHYKVKVDAIEGRVSEIVETIDGTINTYDGDHTLLITESADADE